MTVEQKLAALAVNSDGNLEASLILDNKGDIVVQRHKRLDDMSSASKARDISRGEEIVKLRTDLTDCNVPKRWKRLLGESMVLYKEDVAMFRAHLVAHDFPLRIIDVVSWNGKERRTTAEIVWAICYYPRKRVWIRHVIKVLVVMGLLAVLLPLSTLRTRPRKDTPQKEDPSPIPPPPHEEPVRVLSTTAALAKSVFNVFHIGKRHIVEGFKTIMNLPERAWNDVMTLPGITVTILFLTLTYLITLTQIRGPHHNWSLDEIRAFHEKHLPIFEFIQKKNDLAPEALLEKLKAEFGE